MDKIKQRPLCGLINKILSRAPNSRFLISFVPDRPSYAIDAGKIQCDLGCTPAHTFEFGIRETMAWYLENQEWVNGVKGSLS